MPTPIATALNCADDFDPEAVPVEEARRRILAGLEPLSGFQRVALREGLGRVLAEAVVSPSEVPAHTNSAMDGYALCGADLPTEGLVELVLVGEALAGHPFSGAVGRGACVRIMTGAPIPLGTDTVVMQEQAEVSGGGVRIGTGHQPGQNVRRAGEDIALGAEVLVPGRVLTPADLGLLASLSIAEVAVRRRPRVAFFSTGDELRSIGQPLGEGEVYDSNRYTLFGMLARVGVEVLDLGVVSDDPPRLAEALCRAAADADVVITSGGVSVGEADYIKDLLASLGTMSFWKIAMKPGRPLVFGRIGGSLFFGLPGNPVAVMVTFYQFVQPALRFLMTGAVEAPFLVEAISRARMRKRPGRTEFQRGILARGPDGRLEVDLTGKQGSGVLRSMSLADCFILLPAEQGDVDIGGRVLVQPFLGLV